MIARTGKLPSTVFRNKFQTASLQSTLVVVAFALWSAGHVAAQSSDPLRVQAEVRPGPFLVGQAFELRVGVIAGGQRPRISPPRISGARTWAFGTDIAPISTASIGTMVARENRFVYRFRVLPARAGTLEIPSIQAEIKGRSGRSQPRTLAIQGVPLAGRPAEFLGGVGHFELSAEAAPRVVRVGQELEFRIKVVGPAARGMTDRPELKRYSQLALGLQIDARPDLNADEPPERTFVYRLRPTKAGETTLPPVAISAYDPASAHYVTRVTRGVAIKAVAVPPFDPATFDDDLAPKARAWTDRIGWAAGGLATLLVVVSAGVRRWRHRVDRPLAFGPEPARRFANKTARSPEWIATANDLDPVEQAPSAARRIYALLSHYLLLGTGETVAAMTPADTRHGVARVTGSEPLARLAGEIATRCDILLYGEVAGEALGERGRLLADAQRLFESLGRARSADGRGAW
jgi:hypothetical protein